ncbi:HtaA domain-containing protein [Actinomadura sp. LOL_016]|uniref:HtaA domain-containing protein n=1 Tax=unclassified Actinomadura TaxID=2626254 RepID=UPI003A80ADDD
MSELLWGVKASFRQYVRQTGGTEEPHGKATRREDRFAFEPAGDGLRFEGEVRFQAHGGMLAVTVADPWIVDGMLSVVDTDYLPDRTHRVDIARLGPVTPAEGGRAEAIPYLTTLGVRLLGDVYSVQTEMDPVSFPLERPMIT